MTLQQIRRGVESYVDNEIIAKIPDKGFKKGGNKHVLWAIHKRLGKALECCKP